MKRLYSALWIIALILLMATGLSVAQGRPGMMWRGSGGWGPGTPYNRMYDPKTVETITGEVTSIDRITPNKGMAGGIHMNVKTDKETVSVHLGPSWFLENQDVKIAAKDRVEVRGSRITFGDKSTMIAAEVRKGDDVLKLRDESGFPTWTAWRRR